MDDSVAEIPATMGSQLVSATDSCVAVGCRSEEDGPTEISLDSLGHAEPFGALVFDGEVMTPSKRLSVYSVTNEVLLSSEVPQSRTRLRIFANDISEPDRILILVVASNRPV
jgi:hypothetical protein